MDLIWWWTHFGPNIFFNHPRLFVGPILDPIKWQAVTVPKLDPKFTEPSTRYYIGPRLDPIIFDSGMDQTWTQYFGFLRFHWGWTQFGPRISGPSRTQSGPKNYQTHCIPDPNWTQQSAGFPIIDVLTSRNKKNKNVIIYII